MALCGAERVGLTSSGGEGASQKQPQAKQEDAKHQCKDRHDRRVGRQCRDAGVAADPQKIHEAGLWLRQLEVSRVSLGSAQDTTDSSDGAANVSVVQKRAMAATPTSARRM